MGNVQTVVEQSATCGICFEKKPQVPESIYKKSINCSKLHPFCQDCISKHILSKLETKNTVIRCPGLDCTAELDPVSCRSLIPAPAFVKWSDIMVETWMARQGHRRGVCPSESCREVVIDECRGGGRQKCPMCTMLFCFGCGVEWTTNHHQVCGFEERVFLNAARQGSWRRCPNCRFFVQLRSGCLEIKCRCGTTFCYKCGLERCRCVGRVVHMLMPALLYYCVFGTTFVLLLVFAILNLTHQHTRN